MHRRRSVAVHPQLRQLGPLPRARLRLRLHSVLPPVLMRAIVRAQWLLLRPTGSQLEVCNPVRIQVMHVAACHGHAKGLVSGCSGSGFLPVLWLHAPARRPLVLLPLARHVAPGPITGFTRPIVPLISPIILLLLVIVLWMVLQTNRIVE